MAILQIDDTTPRISYAVGGTPQTVFAVPFAFFEDSDLKVYVDEALKSLTTHYTVSGAGNEAGGSITFLSGQTNVDVVIVRDVPLRKTSEFPLSGPLDLETLNNELSRHIAISQQLLDRIQRTIRLPDGDPSADLVLPSLATRANKLASWDANGEFSPAAGVTDVTVSAAVEPLLSSGTVGAFQTGLNLQRMGAIPCAVSGTASAIVLTPLADTPSLAGGLEDGMEFSFVPSATLPVGFIPTANVAGLGARVIKAPDGYSFALAYDIQKNKPTRIRYAAAQNMFVLADPPLSFKQAIFGNGKVKLQIDGTTSVSCTQDNGQALLVWNPTSQSFRLVALPTITCSNVFAAQNYVEGVANQALSNNQLYAVYVFNVTGTNDQDVALDFYRMYTGIGSEAWTPTINELGLYVKRAAIGSTAADQTRTFVGMIWTAGGNIGTQLNGSVLQSLCHSHYNPWLFPMKSDTVSVTGVTTSTTALQTAPRATIISSGIEMCPHFHLSANVRNNTINQQCSIRLQITGTAFNGTSFSAQSELKRHTSSTVNAWGSLDVEWGVAVPMGVFTAQPLIAVDGGTGEFELTMNVLFAN